MLLSSLAAAPSRIPAPLPSSPESARADFSALAAEVIREELLLQGRLELSTEDMRCLRKRDLLVEENRAHVLRGIGVAPEGVSSAEEAWQIWVAGDGARRFDREAAVRGAVDRRLREHAAAVASDIRTALRGEGGWSPELLMANQAALPLFMRLAGMGGMSEMASRVGSARRKNGLSRGSAERLCQVLQEEGCREKDLHPERVLALLKPTLEGVARDAMGRHFLEALVASALEQEGLRFVPERESGVIQGKYHRARPDFVYPSSGSPQVMIAVRKSSARHSSLYAHELWSVASDLKGRHPDLVCVALVHGDWSKPALDRLGGLFDRVAPVAEARQVAREISGHIQQQKSMLRYRAELRIEAVAPSQQVQRSASAASAPRRR